MDTDQQASIRWMRQVRESLYAGSRIEDQVRPEDAKANRSYLRKLLGPFIGKRDETHFNELLRRPFDDHLFDKLINDMATLVLRTLSDKERSVVAQIPVGGFPGARDFATGTRRSKDGQLAFIGIDCGIVVLLNVLNNIAFAAISDSFAGHHRPPVLLSMTRQVCAYFLTNGREDPPAVRDLGLDFSLTAMAVTQGRMQIAFILAHEYAHHLLGHFGRPGKFDREFPPMPGADLFGINVSDFLNRSLSHDLELEADAKALEICIRLFHSDYPLKSKLDLAGIETLFVNLATVLWLGFHHSILPSDAEREEFIRSQLVGQHPNPIERRMNLSEKLRAHCEEPVIALIGSIMNAHQDILRQLDRQPNRKKSPNHEPSVVRFMEEMARYLDFEGIEIGENGRKPLADGGALLKQSAAPRPAPPPARSNPRRPQPHQEEGDTSMIAAQFQLLLRDIVSIIHGDADPTAYSRVSLVVRNIMDPAKWDRVMQRIRDGERDAASLAAGLDERGRDFVEVVLESLSQGSSRNSAPSASSPLSDLVARFDPLLKDAATIARGQPSKDLWRATNARLNALEKEGSRFPAAVRRIWKGERNLAPLTRDQNALGVLLIQRLLEMLKTES